MVHEKPALPAGREFVVQLHTEAPVDQGQFYWRVEYIVFHQATHFTSIE
ncbi:MAG: hypothetical protein HOP18_20140 [Deltaproteobacteria bacterium]|nr:hypothetical protein [Deltaproteobacteria bacterium]